VALLRFHIKRKSAMMRKLVIAATGLIVGISLAAPSFAGERTGNGGVTPIGTRIVLAAICAFSGLEDHEGGAVTPGDTQTPHESGGTTFPGGVAAICHLLNPGKLRE
jgi:hypothetical protein